MNEPTEQHFVPMTADRFVDELCTIQYISPGLREVIRARIETLELRLAGADVLLEEVMKQRDAALAQLAS